MDRGQTELEDFDQELWSPRSAQKPRSMRCTCGSSQSEGFAGSYLLFRYLPFWNVCQIARLVGGNTGPEVQTQAAHHRQDQKPRRPPVRLVVIIISFKPERARAASKGSRPESFSMF